MLFLTNITSRVKDLVILIPLRYFFVALKIDFLQKEWITTLGIYEY